MSDQLSPPGTRPRESRHLRRRGLGCLAGLIALAVVVGGGYLAVSFGIGALKDALAPAPDYAGNGTGSVLVEVEAGDAASDIAAELLEKGVVKSEEAFTEAAREDPASRGIQVGFYRLHKHMSAEAALAILVDHENLLQNSVTFPEGWTVDQIVAHLAKNTDFTKKQYRRVLRHPARIGLPDYAKGNAEGYLFPATYQIRPDDTPRSILTRMVDTYKEKAEELDLQKQARKLGLGPDDVVTVASLIQAEARKDEDFAKVSRVIYNRLDQSMPLQFDSTVHYAVGRDGTVSTTDEERDVDSPYNTYKHTGLPPTPIMAPGEQAIKAALHPADGDWLYFVTTNPDTGETKFAETYAEHQKNVAEFKDYCARSDSC